MPSSHGSSTTVQFNTDSDGNLTPGFGVGSIDIPEKYGVVFECSHGNFVVHGNDQRHKELWQRMRKDSLVDVTYKEVYTVKFITENGERKILEKKLKDYWFIDAQPKPVTPEKSE